MNPNDKAQLSTGKTEKIFAAISLTIITIAAVFALFTFANRYLKADILKVNHRPVKIQTKEVPVGGVVQFEFDYCKSRPVPSDIIVEFQSDIIYPALGGLKEFPTGCHKVYPKISVPSTVEPGEYELLVRIKYDERSRKEQHLIYSERFYVKPRSDSATAPRQP